MIISQLVNSKKKHHLRHNSHELPVNLDQKIQSLLETAKCSLTLSRCYKRKASSRAVKGLNDDNLKTDIDLYPAIGRKNRDEVNQIYQKFRPYLKLFANYNTLKAIIKQVD